MNIIETKDIHSAIKKGFSLDKDLMEKWHITSGNGLEYCVNKTMLDLKEQTYPDFKFYIVQKDNNFVGYFGQELNGSYLTTIFIAPEYRKNKEEFLKSIYPYMQEKFESAIYSKNVPCMKFFNKIGTEKKRLMINDNEATLFEFNKVGL